MAGIQELDVLIAQEYKHGFESDIDSDNIPKGLSEAVIRVISAKKEEPEWMLEWRLKAYRHWLTMTNRNGRTCIIRRLIIRKSFIIPRRSRKKDGPKSLDEVDPELLETYEKLGIPLQEQEMLGGRRRRRGV